MLLFMDVQEEGFSMKTKTASIRIAALLMALLMCFLFAGCKKEQAETPDAPQNPISQTTPDEYASVWADATYTEDKTFGEGATTFLLEVQVGTHSVTFTVNTDETILGTALLGHGIIDGEQGPYGLYVKTVNGILADYDVNGRYWGFNKNGEYMMTGVDTTEIEAGAHYELVYSK